MTTQEMEERIRLLEHIFREAMSLCRTMSYDVENMDRQAQFYSQIATLQRVADKLDER